MNTVYLLTGGNLGDRLFNLHQCCSFVEKMVGSVVEKSSVYETAAWGITDQPSFLNQVLCIDSKFDAHEILTTVLSIEEKMGRKRIQKMGPRTIDVDILFFNTQTIMSPDLIIPHPEIANRRFVLEPLNEIASSFMHPVLQKSVSQLLAECTDTLKVTLYSANNH